MVIKKFGYYKKIFLIYFYCLHQVAPGYSIYRYLHVLIFHIRPKTNPFVNIVEFRDRTVQ